MSEARTDCPLCGREPGETHEKSCVRSSARMRDRARGTRLLRALNRRRFIWPSAHLAVNQERGARRAIYRSKKRGDHPYPITARISTAAEVQLWLIKDRGTYEKRRYGPLPTTSRGGRR